MNSTNEDFLQSLQDHPTTWTLASIAWLLSCAFVWKLELMALERKMASHHAKDSLDSTSKGARNISELKKLPWYMPEIGNKLNESMQTLLEEYGSVPRYIQQEHIHRIRDTAFEALPIGTIGEFWFLVLGLAEHPMYNRIVKRLTLGNETPRPTLIDLGTRLGQDVRKLIYDGASPDQLLGVDKFPQFLTVGHELFQDQAVTKSCFKTADIFGEEGAGVLDTTRGSWDIVTSAQVLHAFDRAKQKQVLNLMFQLARGKGSWIAGLLTGGMQGHSVPVPPPLVPVGVHVERYIHSAETLRQLFQEASDEGGLSISIDVRYQEDPQSLYTSEITKSFFTSPDARLLFYFVEIL